MRIYKQAETFPSAAEVTSPQPTSDADKAPDDLFYDPNDGMVRRPV